MKNNPSGKLHIISLGCSKNLIDSEVMGGQAAASGMTLVESPDQADIIVINTCGFILPAKEEALEAILTIAEEKKKSGRNLKLIVAGCLAQRYGRELLAEIPEVDLVIGTGETGRIVHHLRHLNTTGYRRSAVITKPDFLMNSRHDRILSADTATAYLKISDGCSNYCTYCAIPSIRGKARSRQPDDILKEAQKLVGRGIREIILIGQDTTAYGRDLKNRPKLSLLLSDLASLPGVNWIRLLYTHPAHITASVLEAVARHPKICRYIDLPVQHIDNTVLSAMNRRVSSERIREIINLARSIMPDVTLRTSLIVGFPGETSKRFERLLDFVQEARFDHLGVFTYSREEGTPAAKMPSRISEKEKEKRRDLIMAQQADISYAINRKWIGSVQEVLIEEKSDREGFAFIGRCRRQAPEVDGITFIRNHNAEIGRIIKCKITAADHYDLYGEIL
ncbi:MAG TPA: 30S ribosomal protein S12 methylthiotransferase RimO [Smithellaceae bacterium]|nr:30S ribosomal protein S12 methylthiotransferase RimO [Smithellaceae bacterium]